jgi:hypothetical protein
MGVGGADVRSRLPAPGRLPPVPVACARAQRPALVPGGFDEQATSVRAARLRDRTLVTSLTGGVLARHQSEEGSERPRPEALPVAELDGEGERGQGADAAQADEPADDVSEGRLRGELRDRPVERTGTSSPKRSSRARRSASRRSVLTRSPAARGIFDGAATVPGDACTLAHAPASP